MKERNTNWRTTVYQLNMLGVNNSRLVELMNAKPFNPNAFLAGHKHATLKRLESQASLRSASKTTQHHTKSDVITLRTTTWGGRGKVSHSDRNFILI